MWGSLGKECDLVCKLRSMNDARHGGIGMNNYSTVCAVYVFVTSILLIPSVSCCRLQRKLVVGE